MATFGLFQVFEIGVNLPSFLMESFELSLVSEHLYSHIYASLFIGMNGSRFPCFE